jgi:DNA-binding phage protein
MERPLILDDADWLRDRYVNDAASISQITADLGVSRSTVERALRHAGIRRRLRGPLPPGGIDPDWLRDAYVVGRVPVVDIAEQARVSRMTVLRALAFHNIARHAVPPRRRRRPSGIPRRPLRPHPHAARPGGIDPAWLRVEYVQRHRTIGEIAKLADVSATTVHKAITVHDLTRSPVRRSRNALNNVPH